MTRPLSRVFQIFSFPTPFFKNGEGIQLARADVGLYRTRTEKEQINTVHPSLATDQWYKVGLVKKIANTVIFGFFSDRAFTLQN